MMLVRVDKPDLRLCQLHLKTHYIMDLHTI